MFSLAWDRHVLFYGNNPPSANVAVPRRNMLMNMLSCGCLSACQCVNLAHLLCCIQGVDEEAVTTLPTVWGDPEIEPGPKHNKTEVLPPGDICCACHGLQGEIQSG